MVNDGLQLPQNESQITHSFYSASAQHTITHLIRVINSYKAALEMKELFDSIFCFVGLFELNKQIEFVLEDFKFLYNR